MKSERPFLSQLFIASFLLDLPNGFLNAQNKLEAHPTLELDFLPAPRLQQQQLLSRKPGPLVRICGGSGARKEAAAAAAAPPQLE